jgi:ERCC4-related helicase
MLDPRGLKSENKTKIIEMKTTVILATAIIGFTVLASLAYAEDEENNNHQTIAISDMPAAVQKTIQDNLDGGTITRTAKETEESDTVYEAYVKKSEGEEVEIKVTSDGRLIGVGKEEEDDDQEGGEDGCR